MSIMNEDDWKIILANRKNINKKNGAWEVPEESASEDLSDVDLNFDTKGDN